jgi:hypothetical protein
MSSFDSQIEEAVLNSLVPNLEAEGFQVILQPSRSLLPQFMQSYRPDAIALKENRKIAIEVTAQGSPSADSKLKRLRDLFAEHEDWELRVLYAPLRTDENVSITSSQALHAALDRLPMVLEVAGPVPALLTAWAAFEAAARALTPASLGRAQAPTRLIEVLASDGYLTPKEADRLRILGRLRSAAAHGNFEVSLSADELNEFINVTKALLEMQAEGQGTPSK